MLTIIVGSLITILDQLTKWLAKNSLPGTDGIRVLGRYLQLQYVENRGAAFGILEGKTAFFFIVTAAVVFFLLRYVFTGEKKSTGELFAIGLILGGAVGNFIDRMYLGYVVDFIQLDFVDFHQFPVFNIADMGVTIGAAFLIFLLYRDSTKSKIVESKGRNSGEDETDG